MSSKILCDFCGKSSRDVKLLIAGPADVHICDACVDVCAEIVAEKRQIHVSETTKPEHDAGDVSKGE